MLMCVHTRVSCHENLCIVFIDVRLLRVLEMENGKCREKMCSFLHSTLNSVIWRHDYGWWSK